MSDFSFTILSDSHVDVREDAEDGYWWNTMLVSRSREILATAVDDVNERGADFVVHCGDITNLSDPASYGAAFEILSHLDCPLYCVPGNHDTYLPDSRRLAAEHFGLQSPTLYRTVDIHGWRLVFIDAVYWLRKDGEVYESFDLEQHVDHAVPDFELDWLRGELDRDPDRPTMCFTHPVMASRDEYPVSRMPHGEPVTQRPFTLREYFGETESLRALIKRTPCIKAVFYGHGHCHDCIVEDGILYCQTASLIEYPNEIRQVRVSSQRIEVEVFPLSSGNFPESSYVPSGGNRWVAGRAADRRTSHSL